MTDRKLITTSYLCGEMAYQYPDCEAKFPPETDENDGESIRGGGWWNIGDGMVTRIW